MNTLNLKEFSDYKDGDEILYRECDSDGDYECNVCKGKFIACNGNSVIILDDNIERVECRVYGYYAIGNIDTNQIVVFSDNIGYTQYIDQKIMKFVEHLRR